MPGSVPGLAIGLTVALCALFDGPATGASMNPARSLAPALFARGPALSTLPLYLLVPPIRAVLTALCYELLRDGTLHALAAGRTGTPRWSGSRVCHEGAEMRRLVPR